MSFTPTFTISIKHIRNTRIIKRRFSSFECSRERFTDVIQKNDCFRNDMVCTLSAASSDDTDALNIGYQLNNRQKEQFVKSLSRALACNVGEFSPLRNEVNRIKQLRFSTSARNINKDAHVRLVLSREELRDVIVERCSLSPP